MKKIISILLLACLLLPAAALAEYQIGNVMRVANCNEYITLRAEPSTKAEALDRIPLNAELTWIGHADNDFAKVSYGGRVGYALRKYLDLERDFSGPSELLDREQRYNINLFLSNFTESYFAVPDGCVYDAGDRDDAMLNNFALDHIWFNKQQLLEWGEWGEWDGNNVRVAAKELPEVIRKYFGVESTDLNVYNYVSYDGKYYYWTETGGHTPDGFACLNRVAMLAEDEVAVCFSIYGSGYPWENDVCYMDAEEAAAAYPNSHVYEGFAVIRLAGEDKSLRDRTGWNLERYVIDTVW